MKSYLFFWAACLAVLQACSGTTPSDSTVYNCGTGTTYLDAAPGREAGCWPIPACAPERCVTTLPGACAEGRKECNADGTHGACQPIRLPTDSVEQCGPFLTGNGVDDDCNGATDDICGCQEGLRVDCVISGKEGECARGTRQCQRHGVGTRWTECATSTVPTVETCDNGKDEDCDGEADENEVCSSRCVPRTFTRCEVSTRFGACKAGLKFCFDDGSGFDECVPNQGPALEVCGNGEDEDCDGMPDDGCDCAVTNTQLCDTGEKGVCKLGTQICRAKTDGFTEWGFCARTEGPAAEVCGDGKDNDCDGNVDNGCACRPSDPLLACNTGLPGRCATGAMRCKADGTGLTNTCELTLSALPEVCGNGIDEDCDGRPDNGCTCALGGTPQTCYTGLQGACATGTSTCRSTPAGSTEWGPCVQNTPAAVEVCGDAVDNDCDGTLNNGCAAGAWCLDADGDNMGTLSNCVSSFTPIAGRVQNTLDCNDSSKFARPGAREACAPNLDLDCDGLRGSADPDAICYGTIRYSWNGVTQSMTTDLVGSQPNAILTTARWSEPNKDPRVGNVTAVEVGSDFSSCWSLTSNCGRVLYTTDPFSPNPPVTMTFGLAPNGISQFTPRVETSAGEVVYLDLYNWAAVDINAADGVLCNVVTDAADTGLVTRCAIP